MKYIIPIIMMVLLSFNIVAYVTPIDYNGVKIKYYADKKMDRIYNILDAAPDNILDGLLIRFFDSYLFCWDYAGRYFPGFNEIRICDWSEDTLIHELAHIDNSKNHGKEFQKTYNLYMGELKWEK